MLPPAGDGVLPMRLLPFDELYLCLYLSSWLPPVPDAPTGEQLEHIARDAAQQYLQQEEVADGNSYEH